jgi:NADP+-dependent farnesol dehydrogenase
LFGLKLLTKKIIVAIGQMGLTSTLLLLEAQQHKKYAQNTPLDDGVSSLFLLESLYYFVVCSVRENWSKHSDKICTSLKKMDRWQGKIAVVTGASAGIGSAIVVDLVKAGMVVVGLARRPDRIEALKSNIPERMQKNVHAMKCDVSKEPQIIATFAEIEKKFGGVDVLVNNAGIIRTTSLIAPDNSVPLSEIIDTNVMGLVFCTREAVQSMKKRGDNGHTHIVHINSIAGHSVQIMIDISSPNIYPASKYAVTALTESLRQELIAADSKIKVTVSAILKF